MVLPIAVFSCKPGLGQVVAEEGDRILGRLLKPCQPHARIQRAHAFLLSYVD